MSPLRPVARAPLAPAPLAPAALALAPLAPLLIALGLLSGCQKPVPTEQVPVISLPAAPGLPEPEDDEPSTLTLHVGDVVYVTERGGHLAWEGLLDGQKVRHEGSWVGVRRAPREGTVFTLDVDVGPPVAVPTTAFLCSTSPSPIQVASLGCPDVLHRIRIDDRRTVGYLPCPTPGCPVGLVEGRSSWWSRVDGLQTLSLRPFAGRPLLVGMRMWSEGGVSGTSLVLLSPSAGLPRVGDLVLDQVDARDNKTSKMLQLAPRFEGDAVRLEGSRTETDIASGKRLSLTPVTETYRLGPDGKLARQ